MGGISWYLVDKAFPDLQEEAKEQLSLDHAGQGKTGSCSQTKASQDPWWCTCIHSGKYIIHALQSWNCQQPLAVSSLTHTDTASSIVGALQAKQDAMWEMIINLFGTTVSGSERNDKSSKTYVPHKAINLLEMLEGSLLSVKSVEGQAILLEAVLWTVEPVDLWIRETSNPWCHGSGIQGVGTDPNSYYYTCMW